MLSIGNQLNLHEKKCVWLTENSIECLMAGQLTTLSLKPWKTQDKVKIMLNIITSNSKDCKGVPALTPISTEDRTKWITIKKDRLTDCRQIEIVSNLRKNRNWRKLCAITRWQIHQPGLCWWDTYNRISKTGG